jgi:hypothetical protein
MSRKTTGIIMKAFLRKMSLVLAFFALVFTFSCSKEDTKVAGGNQIYYVIEGVYGSIPNEAPRVGQVEVIASMTMPSGSVSKGNTLTTHTSATREYPSGMTITVNAESVLSYTTITVKIYRNGTLWKTNTATATGFGKYAVATATGTL